MFGVNDYFRTRPPYRSSIKHESLHSFAHLKEQFNEPRAACIEHQRTSHTRIPSPVERCCAAATTPPRGRRRQAESDRDHLSEHIKSAMIMSSPGAAKHSVVSRLRLLLLLPDSAGIRRPMNYDVRTAHRYKALAPMQVYLRAWRT